jgi:mannose/fructose/N-acetylgalactosamine-specific phosphotransferase system component IID
MMGPMSEIRQFVMACLMALGATIACVLALAGSAIVAVAILQLFQR